MYLCHGQGPELPEGAKEARVLTALGVIVRVLVKRLHQLCAVRFVDESLAEPVQMPQHLQHRVEEAALRASRVLQPKARHSRGRRRRGGGESGRRRRGKEGGRRRERRERGRVKREEKREREGGERRGREKKREKRKREGEGEEGKREGEKEREGEEEREEKEGG